MRRRFIGNDQTRASAVQAVEATGMQEPPPRAVHPGNFSGYDNAKSAYLQHSQGGYYNPNVQRARYSTSSLRKAIPEAPSAAFSSRIAGNILDRRMVKSSSGSLAKLLKSIK